MSKKDDKKNLKRIDIKLNDDGFFESVDFINMEGVDLLLGKLQKIYRNIDKSARIKRSELSITSKKMGDKCLEV